jgi:hypothetical protein
MSAESLTRDNPYLSRPTTAQVAVPELSAINRTRSPGDGRELRRALISGDFNFIGTESANRNQPIDGYRLGLLYLEN